LIKRHNYSVERIAALGSRSDESIRNRDGW